jgi:hypothetical protein
MIFTKNKIIQKFRIYKTNIKQKTKKLIKKTWLDNILEFLKIII